MNMAPPASETSGGATERAGVDRADSTAVDRSRADAVIYVTPTEDNLYQTSKMKSHGIFSEVYQEVGEIIVAEVNRPRIAELLQPDRVALRKLITKEG